MLALRNIFPKTKIISKTRSFCVFKSPNKVTESLIGATDKGKVIMSLYPDFVKEMKSVVGRYDAQVAEKHLERVLSYNVGFGGKKNRAKMVVDAFEQTAPKAALTEANCTLAVYLGWCHEVMHAFYLIVDDIMDGSETRRGQRCWYKNDDVKMSAINDALILQAATFNFLTKHFGHMKCYANLLESLHQNLLISTIGENMDLNAQQQDVLSFTVEQFRRIVAHKTAHHSTYVPIELAYCLAGCDLQVLENSKNILYEIGIFFQIQDDFLDCFGDPAVTGKLGTDIEDGKCTWLAVAFLDRATEAQKAALKKLYGKKDKESVKSVKKLYDEVDLREAYTSYEAVAYNAIKEGIEQSNGIPKKLCQDLIDKLYKRRV